MQLLREGIGTVGDLNATTARRDWDSGRFKFNYCEKGLGQWEI